MVRTCKLHSCSTAAEKGLRSITKVHIFAALKDMEYVILSSVMLFFLVGEY